MSKTIFLVDDEIDYLEAISEVLPSHFTIEKFSSSFALLERLDSGFSADLIMTDIRMPGMNGIELCKEIKKREIKTPLIIVSGNASKDDAIEALHLGAFDLLEKPCNINLLRHAVERAVMYGSIKILNEELFTSMNLIVTFAKDLLQNYEQRYFESEKKLFQSGLLSTENKDQVEWQAKTQAYFEQLDATYEALLEKKIKIQELMTDKIK